MDWEIRKVNNGYWLYKDDPCHELVDKDVWIFEEWRDVVQFLYDELHTKKESK